MDKTEIIDKVNAFLAEDLEIDAEKLHPEARIREDLGIDSLDLVDIVVIVDKTFGFKLKSDEMRNVLTLGQFYDHIASKMA